MGIYYITSNFLNFFFVKFYLYSVSVWKPYNCTSVLFCTAVFRNVS